MKPRLFSNYILRSFPSANTWARLAVAPEWEEATLNGRDGLTVSWELPIPPGERVSAVR